MQTLVIILTPQKRISTSEMRYVPFHLLLFIYFCSRNELIHSFLFNTYSIKVEIKYCYECLKKTETRECSECEATFCRDCDKYDKFTQTYFECGFCTKIEECALMIGDVYKDDAARKVELIALSRLIVTHRKKLWYSVRERKAYVKLLGNHSPNLDELMKKYS